MRTDDRFHGEYHRSLDIGHSTCARARPALRALRDPVRDYGPVAVTVLTVTVAVTVFPPPATDVLESEASVDVVLEESVVSEELLVTDDDVGATGAAVPA